MTIKPSLTQFCQWYVWLQDEGIFYDTRIHRARSETHIISEMLQIDFNGNVAEVIKSMKMMGTSRDSLKDTKKLTKKPTKVDLSRQLYNEVKSSLPVRLQVMPPDLLVYTINKQNEVSLFSKFDNQVLIKLLYDHPEVNSIIKVALENCDLGSKLEYTDYLQLLAKQISGDHSLSLPRNIPLISWDPNIAAYKSLDATILKDGPHPTWDQFLSRLEYPETFKAYVWSIFDPNNFGRQALWIHGEGNDGKSTVLNTLADFMGHDHVLALSKGSYEGEYFFGAALGKRLAIYNDCKNPHVIRSERIKSLLGGDVVSANSKYIPIKSAKVYSKLLFGANMVPSINYNDRSERTRLLLTAVTPYPKATQGDANFGPNLKAELPHFLFSCRQTYEVECPTGMNLRVPPKMDDTIKQLCNASDSDIITDFINKHVEMGSKFKVSKTDMRYALKTYLSGQFMTNNQMQFADLDLQKTLLQMDIILDAGHYVGCQLRRL
jgi:hypothetical protein